MFGGMGSISFQSKWTTDLDISKLCILRYISNWQCVSQKLRFSWILTLNWTDQLCSVFHPSQVIPNWIFWGLPETINPELYQFLILKNRWYTRSDLCFPMLPSFRMFKGMLGLSHRTVMISKKSSETKSYMNTHLLKNHPVKDYID